MIDEIKNKNWSTTQISFLHAEPGDEFVIVNRLGFDRSLSFTSFTVQRVLQRDVICTTSDGKEMRFNKNKEINNAYLPGNEELVAMKAEQAKNDMVYKAWVVAVDMKRNALNPDDPEDLELINRLIDYRKRKESRE